MKAKILTLLVILSASLIFLYVKFGYVIQPEYHSIYDLRYLNILNDKDTVIITGTVNQVVDVPFLSYGAYKLYDENAEIWIISNSAAPVVGEAYIVRGTVQKTTNQFKMIEINGCIVYELNRKYK